MLEKKIPGLFSDPTQAQSDLIDDHIYFSPLTASGNTCNDHDDIIGDASCLGFNARIKGKHSICWIFYFTSG